MLGQACAHLPCFLWLCFSIRAQGSGPTPPLEGTACALVQVFGLHPKPQGGSAPAFLYFSLCFLGS